MEKRPVVIALGGNAISRKGEEGNIDQQFSRSRDTACCLADLVADGHALVITHGNGPQVGNVLRRVELAASEVYPIPLHICVADTQAGMGFMIAQTLNNELRRRGREAPMAQTIITTVEVDRGDGAFKKPTKPIGQFLKKEEAMRFKAQYDWAMQEFEGGEFRRVVASPTPLHIQQIAMIRKLVGEGELLVCGGGGGIAVWRDEKGDYVGVDCVIDKDRTSALLAVELDAGAFLIATAVEKVMLDFKKPNQRALDRLTVSEAKRFLADGQFPAGTMGPKIEAAVDFLERSKRKDAIAIISDLEHMVDALRGTTGTRVLRG